MNTSSNSPDFFDELYRKGGDPWAFASSPYELSRYQTTCDMLRGKRFRRGFEPACSIGVLTAMLAAQCEQLYASDVSPTAVAEARQRCANLSNVEINCGALPGDLPDGTFDLIVFSEVGYYFEEDQLFELGQKLLFLLEVSGTFLAVHWLGHSPDHVLSGDHVHAILRRLPGLALEESQRHPGFRIDRWSRT